MGDRTASYYNATVDGKTVNDIAWYVRKHPYNHETPADARARCFLGTTHRQQRKESRSKAILLSTRYAVCPILDYGKLMLTVCIE